MNKNKGFTLIEMILYLAIVSGFLTALIFFAWNIIYSREKANQLQIVEQSSRVAMLKIGNEIRKAKNIVSVSPSQIVLDNNGSTTTVGLSSGKVQLTDSLGGPYSLTSNQVTVSNLVFSETSSLDTNSKGIKIDLTLEQSSSILSGQTKAKTNFSQSVELKGQFSQGRSLLIDSSLLALSIGNKRLEGINLSDSSSENIILDKMTVSWTGGALGSALQNILINGATVWSGSVVSGDLLEIVNVTISPSDSFPLVLNFSKAMDSSIVEITFTLSDGSTSLVSLSFGTGPTGTPIPTVGPTLTPTPLPSNCNQHCQQIYGTSGNCLKSNNCSGHNEGRIYECASPNICCCQ